MPGKLPKNQLEPPKQSEENESNGNTESERQTELKESLTMAVNISADELESKMIQCSNTSLRDEIFKQISTQVLEMTEITLTNSEKTMKMTIQVNGVAKSVEVAKIASDGDCLFAALVHQIHHVEINSDDHDRLCKKIRLEVVDHIKKNFGRYEN